MNELQLFSKQVLRGEESRTFLKEGNINHLKRMFDTPENWAKYMRCLWLFRELVHSKNENGKEFVSNPLFPLLETINELMGCLFQEGIRFDGNGQAYKYENGKVVYLNPLNQ